LVEVGAYYTVQQGDCLNSLARTSGFSDYTTLYRHPKNAALREKRPNPNIICPGDILFIPDRTVQEIPCATNQSHQFTLTKKKVYLRLCLQDDLHNPYLNTNYRLRVEAADYAGATDSTGLLEQEIPADAVDGEITIFPFPDDPSDPGYTFTLKLGHLDPIDEDSGVDARLINLGFGPTDSDNPEWSDDDRGDALKAFQDRFGLEITGMADDATRQKLRALHDDE
jgi:N-acetylmuramoyl-L-alanine amidase